MERENQQAQGAAQVGASDHGQALVRTSASALSGQKHLRRGFHAGLLDTGFMTLDDPAMDVTMSG